MNLGTYIIKGKECTVDYNYVKEVILRNRYDYRKVSSEFNVKPPKDFEKGYSFFCAKEGRRVEKLSTSKVRGLLDLVNNLYSKVYYDDSNDISKIIDDIEYLDVKFAYEAGRDATVKKFLDESLLRKLLPIVIKKNSKKYFIDYCKYFEAYVAYMKFEGMGD